MTSHDPLAEQLDSIIARIVTDLETKQVIMISPENVANEVDTFIDPDGVSPKLKTYASIMQIRQSTRAYLRKRHDPVEKAEQQIKDGVSDMFSDQIQEYYPVERESKKAYVKTENCSIEELNICITRMQKAAYSMLAHVDALKAYIASRPEENRPA